MPPRSLGTLAAALLVLAAVSAARADMWNLANDYSGTSNPSGAWSYGWKPNLAGAYTVFDFPQTGPGGSPQWYMSTHHDGNNTPSIFKNTTGGTLMGVLPGEVTIHPGPSYEPCVVRWTSPVYAQAQVTGYFGAGDSGVMDVYILRNGVAIWDAQDFTTNRPFSMTLEVTPGDALDFLVTGAYYSGNTPVQAAIMATPEPMSLLLLGGGIGLAALRRRRRAGTQR